VVPDQVPSVAIAVDAGTLSFVDRSRQLEHRSAWMSGLRASVRVWSYAEAEIGGFVAGGDDRPLRTGGGLFLGARIGEFVGPVRPVFGLHAGLAYVTHERSDVSETKPFFTITPSFGVDFPATRHFTFGSAIAYTYAVDLDEPQIGPEADREPRSHFDRTWITLSANVRYRF
jgi:hypothetical protein